MNRGRWLRAEKISAVVAVALLAYRFCNLDLVTFINDEPRLLAAAEREAQAGEWVSASPIAGSHALNYGPVAIWFYGIVHVLFGANPLVSIVAMGLLVTLGQLIFLGMLTKSLRGGPAIFGALTVLVAGSPYTFTWSRAAWDNPLLIATFSCAALLLITELGTGLCLTAGTLFGISLGTHLMVLPVLLVLLAVTFWPQRHQPVKIARQLALLGAPMLVINLPYLFYLAKTRPHLAAVLTAQAPQAPPPFSLDAALTVIVTTFLAPARILTTAGISYFFDDSWSDFRTSLSGWTIPVQGAWFAVILAGFAIAGLVLSLRSKTPTAARRLAALALASWFFYALFLLVDGLQPHPHYQHPVWWTVPAGIALLHVWLRARSEILARSLVASVWILALIQFSFLPMWMRYVRERGGTQGIHFTTPLTEERAWIRDACGADQTFAIENHTVLFKASLDYLASTDAACTGHHVAICDGTCAGDQTPVVQLRYANAIGGHLMPFLR